MPTPPIEITKAARELIVNLWLNNGIQPCEHIDSEALAEQIQLALNRAKLEGEIEGLKLYQKSFILS